MNKKAYEVFKEIGMMVEDIYTTQLKPGTLYPRGLSKVQIKELFTDNEITDSFLILQNNDRPRSVKYGVFFRTDLEVINRKLGQISRLLNNPYYKEAGRCLTEGDYLNLEKLWLAQNEDQINMSIGPLLGYHDKLFGTKNYYSFCLMERNKTMEARLNSISAAAVDALNNYFNSVVDKEKYKVLCGRILVWAGEIRDMKPIAWARPNGKDSVQLVKKYGAKSLYFEDSLLKRAKEGYKKIPPGLVDSASYSALDNQEFLPVSTLLHEIGHIFLTDENAEIRSKDLYRFIDELKADSVAFISLAKLFESGTFTREQMNKAFLSLVGDMLLIIEMAKIDRSRIYHAASANYLLKMVLVRDAVDWNKLPSILINTGTAGLLLYKKSYTLMKKEFKRFTA